MKEERKSNIQVLAETLAPAQHDDQEDAMKLKRTTVLSGNFAKKSVTDGRSRTASDSVQLVTPHNFHDELK